MDDWETWLDLSATPPTTSRARATVRHYVNDGHLVDNDLWPTEGGCQIYAAFDDTSTVYVGQTTMALAKRIRKHFGNQQTDMQRRKAGTWRFIITATFPGLAPGELDRLERSAADWLLPLRHRAGHRHPQGR